MKNTLIASLVALVLVGGAALPVQALSISEIQNQIQELLARVAALRTQMNQIQGQDGSQTTGTTAGGIVPSQGRSHRICALLNRNLSQGMSGDDVRGMQEFLQSEGFLAASPTGYFGPMTAQAIAKWQAKEGLTQVGVFGPLSRERIKRWCGGGGGDTSSLLKASPTRGAAPLTVTFSSMAGGEQPQVTSYLLDFGDGTSAQAPGCRAPLDVCVSPGTQQHTYAANGTYRATLSRVFNPCLGNPVCLAPVSSEVIGSVVITVGAASCTKEYNPVCGLKQVVCVTTPCNPIQQTYGNRCAMEADGATFVHAGECRGVWDDPAQNPQCKSWYDGCNTCSRETPQSPAMCTLRACAFDTNSKPYCTAWFDSSTNKPPTVSSFSGPTVLKVGENGTWNIRASDPENGTLSYNITWGDEVANTYASSLDRSFTQSTTFTHSYSRVGTYTVTITVRDEAGKSATATATVRVSSGTIGGGCSEEYAPVCGRPPGCANTCPAGQYCTMICQLPEAKTYSNRCQLDAAGADFIHQGSCTSSGAICTADAFQCPNGTWVGRTGPNCQFVCN